MNGHTSKYLKHAIYCKQLGNEDATKRPHAGQTEADNYLYYAQRRVYQQSKKIARKDRQGSRFLLALNAAKFVKFLVDGFKAKEASNALHSS